MSIWASEKNVKCLKKRLFSLTEALSGINDVVSETTERKRNEVSKNLIIFKMFFVDFFIMREYMCNSKFLIKFFLL